MWKEISKFSKKTSDKLSESLKGIDNKLGVSDKFSKSIDSISERVEKADRDLGISTNTKKALEEVKAKLSNVGASYDESELKMKLNQLSDSINDSVFIPAKKQIEKYEISDKIGVTKDQVVLGYGWCRGKFKVYKAPKDARDLLTKAREELLYINSCILQISMKESEKFASNFGKAVTAKVAGIASVGGLFALVSTFGSASTGTAIAGLSGAAANSATLAWIGSLVGGGMVAGSVLTGGIGLVIGAAAYSALSSTPRNIESLSEEERKIIESSSLFIAAIDEVLVKESVQLSLTEAKALLNDIILPLNEQLTSQKDIIMEQLDETNKLLFQEHALTDFQGNVIGGFESYIENTPLKINPIFVISGVILGLLSGSEIENTSENMIAIEALKRMKNEWSEYTNLELGEALSDFSSESLKGVANNAKGIYHELLFIEEFNRQNVDQQARVFDKTNEPGADIQIYSVDTGETVQEAQLKALQDSSGISHHFDKYPDVDVIATSEVSSAFEGVQNSGFSNEELTADMNSVISKLSADSSLDATTDIAAITLLISAGKDAIDVLNGNKGVSEAGKETILNVSVAASSTLFASYLFST
ncbi:hypothetical protein [Thalassotalea crassostreae]|uniref:hypothetical protein n=1 Tax=Thalassotalea crassostreae TaxID=1763536 RepID=UPI000837C548|nr:hypothetical protein [Thalassotalea crassostreae]